MKTIRRVLAILLVLTVNLTSVLCVSNAAEEDQKFPIIIVAGYGGTSLYKVSPDNPQDNVWYVGNDVIKDTIVSNLVPLLFGVFRWVVTGSAAPLADTAGVLLEKVLYDLTIDEDGKPVTQLYRYHYTAAEVSTAYLNEEEDGKYIHEGEIMPYVTQDLGDKAEEWTFNFTTDFRQNSIYCARDLAYLVKGAKEQTGQEQVNLFAVSHGGQVTSTYLAMCAIAAKGGAEARKMAEHLGLTVDEATELFDAHDIHNAVLTVPATGGALLAYDAFNDDVSFDEETLLYFIENGNMMEIDMHWLFAAQQLGFLDDLIHYLLPHVMKVISHWGSMWDFMPLDKYEAIKEKAASERFLRSDVIAQSDYFHDSILNHMAEYLQKTEELGTNVYFIAGAGAPSITGTQESSDAIIPLSGATGATLAPFGRRFSNGYQTLNTQCSDPTHHHLSPAMDIDMSTGYLPETTWIVDGLFHGMTYKDIYSRTLMKMLVESDERITVHDKKEYPQFHEAMNVCESVYAEFGASKTGFVGADDHTLIVQNLSKESKMTLLAVSTDNPNLRFSAKQIIGRTIAPQDSITLDVTGTVQQKSLETMHVTVSYCLVGSATPVNEKTFTFTVMNGEADPYNAAEPFTDAGTPEQLSRDWLSQDPLGQLLTKTDTGAVAVLFWRILVSALGLAFQR